MFWSIISADGEKNAIKIYMKINHYTQIKAIKLYMKHLQV